MSDIEMVNGKEPFILSFFFFAVEKTLQVNIGYKKILVLNYSSMLSAHILVSLMISWV